MQGGFFLLIWKQRTGCGKPLMAYQLSTLVDEIIDLSKDPTFSRSRVTGYIQHTQDLVLGRYRFKFNEKRSLVGLVIGDATYTPTPTTPYQSILGLVLSHIDLAQPAQPEYMPPDSFFETFPAPETQPQGVPHYYTDFGGVIYWSCPLDKAYSLGLRYQAAPKRLSADGDVPDLPEEFSDLLIKGGLAGVEEFRENFDIAAVRKREIEDLSRDLLGRYGLRKMQPGKVKSVRFHRGQF